MIEVDDSQLTNDHRAFLNQWAGALDVPFDVLAFRILSATIDGDPYVEQRPRLLIAPEAQMAQT
jgi:hypothetical protein